MPHIQLSDQLYTEAERRARQAGYGSVDEFVADRLESDFSTEDEDFDGRFTPEVLQHLDQVSEEMIGGKFDSPESVDEHLKSVREEWLKNRAS